MGFSLFIAFVDLLAQKVVFLVISISSSHSQQFDEIPQRIVAESTRALSFAQTICLTVNFRPGMVSLRYITFYTVSTVCPSENLWKAVTEVISTVEALRHTNFWYFRKMTAASIFFFLLKHIHDTFLFTVFTRVHIYTVWGSILRSDYALHLHILDSTPPFDSEYVYDLGLVAPSHRRSFSPRLSGTVLNHRYLPMEQVLMMPIRRLRRNIVIVLDFHRESKVTCSSSPHQNIDPAAARLKHLKSPENRRLQACAVSQHSFHDDDFYTTGISCHFGSRSRSVLASYSTKSWRI